MWRDVQYVDARFMLGNLSRELKGDAMAALRSEYRTQRQPPLRSDHDPGFKAMIHIEVLSMPLLSIVKICLEVTHSL